MPYVMVPVPAEHEAEVTQFVLRISLGAALKTWDAASMAQLFEELEPLTQSVVVQIALGNLEGTPISDRVVGDLLGVPPGEVVNGVLGVNAVCTAHGWPSLILMATAFEDQPGGTERVVNNLVLRGEQAQLALRAGALDGSRSRD